ncbi:MAG: isoprenylcysteine carboxylmethyltransferase family protein [Bacteroidota bacterium]|jgi:protein-S-isoprenylcysteine O-methyltransferase Ste14
MKNILEAFVRIALFVLIVFLWSWVLHQRLSNIMDILIIVGGILLIFPIAWLGRKMLDKKPTASRAAWITTFIHYTVVILAGVAVIRATKTHQDWAGWVLPVPTEIGSLLVIVTGGATLLTVINLALKGLGAPFAIALSRKLAVDWLYAWTRNPMVLAVLALGISLGVWFQSILFVLWVLILFTPAILFFVKVYEERELEFRFGSSYLEYKSRTPMLFPRKPKG